MADNIRNIVKNGRGSYYINIPKEMAEELKWKEKKSLLVRRTPKGISISPVPPKKKAAAKKKATAKKKK